MTSFQISDAPTKIEMAKPAEDGSFTPGKVTFTVRNMGPRAQTGRIKVEPQSGAEPSWFAITGAPDTSPAELEKEFDFGGNEAIEVNVKPPKGAKAGSYGLQVRVTAEQDPDTDFVLSPVVAFQLEAPPVKPVTTSGFPWWIVAVAAVLVIAIGVGAFFVIKNLGGGAKIVMPDLKGQDVQTAAVLATSLMQTEKGKDPVPTSHNVSFVVVNDATAPALTVLTTNPGAEEKVEADQAVVLTISAPSGACASLLCMFPSAIFPADVIQALSVLNFDGKYAEALSKDGNMLVLDAAKVAEIKNRQPPVPTLTIPNLAGVDFNQAIGILGTVGFAAQSKATTEGAQNHTVLRTEPPAGATLKKGEVVTVIYTRPKVILDPCIRVGCFEVNPGLVLEMQPVSPQILREMSRMNVVVP